MPRRRIEIERGSGGEMVFTFTDYVLALLIAIAARRRKVRSMPLATISRYNGTVFVIRTY